MPTVGFCAALLHVFLARAPGSPSAAAAGPAPGGIEINFDFQAADATLAVLSGAATMSPAAVARLPGNVRLVEQQHRFDASATPERFAQALSEAAATGKPSPDTFAFGRTKDRLMPTQALLARVKTHPTELADAIRFRIAKYTPAGLKLPVTVYFVAGGTSDGFASGSVFCVALDYFRDDYAGLRTMMAHELFHVAYAAVTRAAPEDSKALAPPAEAARVLPLFEETMNEGIASRVGDPTIVTDGKAWIEWFQGKFQKNFERLEASFALFDTVLYREYYDPGAPTDRLYQVGFSGSFDSVFYFVGYEMARVIEQEDGPGAVAGALSENPLRFFKRYVAISLAHPERVRYQFGASTEEILRRLSAANPTSRG